MLNVMTHLTRGTHDAFRPLPHVRDYGFWRSRTEDVFVRDAARPATIYKLRSILI